MTEEEKFWKALRELEEEDKRLAARINEVFDGHARFVEGITSPSAVKIFESFGYRVNSISHRYKIRQDGQIVAEYDTLLIGEKDGKKVLFVGEASSHMTSDKVKRFVDLYLPNVREWLKEYVGYEVIGFVSGVDYDQGVDTYAVKEGLYVLKPSGEQMVLDVPKGFKPKKW